MNIFLTLRMVITRKNRIDTKNLEDSKWNKLEQTISTNSLDHIKDFLR